VQVALANAYFKRLYHCFYSTTIILVHTPVHLFRAPWTTAWHEYRWPTDGAIATEIRIWEPRNLSLAVDLAGCIHGLESLCSMLTFSLLNLADILFFFERPPCWHSWIWAVMPHQLSGWAYATRGSRSCTDTSALSSVTAEQRGAHKSNPPPPLHNKLNIHLDHDDHILWPAG